MDNILQWGIQCILIIQRLDSPVLHFLFRVITSLGDEPFYLIFFPFLLWCIDFYLGIKVGIIFLLSVSINSGLKEMFQQPRPFVLLPEIQKISASGFGFPSGHAQSSMVVWGSITYLKKQIWIRNLSILFILSIGFSRIYLGVHFPTDILGGWIFGGLILGVSYLIFLHVKINYLKKNTLLKLIIVTIVPLILLPFQLSQDMMSSLASLTGIGYGLILFQSFIVEIKPGKWFQRFFSFLIGIIGIGIIYLGLKFILPSENESFYQFGRFLRYLVLGVWISFGAPWLFIRLGIACQNRKQNKKVEGHAL